MYELLLTCNLRGRERNIYHRLERAVRARFLYTDSIPESLPRWLAAGFLFFPHRGGDVSTEIEDATKGGSDSPLRSADDVLRVAGMSSLSSKLVDRDKFDLLGRICSIIMAVSPSDQLEASKKECGPSSGPSLHALCKLTLDQVKSIASAAYMAYMDESNRELLGAPIVKDLHSVPVQDNSNLFPILSARVHSDKLHVSIQTGDSAKKSKILSMSNRSVLDNCGSPFRTFGAKGISNYRTHMVRKLQGMQRKWVLLEDNDGAKKGFAFVGQIG